jgi:hypothetical protein
VEIRDEWQIRTLPSSDIDIPAHAVLKEDVVPKREFYFSLFIILILVLMAPVRAFAYGDPSGGYLFQMLTPLAAMLWGAWLIFAGAIRKKVGKIFHRTRLATLEEPGSDDAENS